MNGGAIRTGDGVVEVSGDLTFATVPGVLAEGSAWINGNPSGLTVDLKGVTRTDSAGVALMLEWLRLARAADRPLHFVNLSDQLIHLIRVSGLSQAFALK